MGFLRQLFGPSQAEVWRRLAEETGSNFVDGGFWRGSKVVAPGVIKDVDRLKSLFKIFALILHLLCHLDSAYENDPEIQLK